MRIEFFFNLVFYKSFPLLELKSEPTGRSFGRITVAHRASGIKFKFIATAIKVLPLDVLSKVAAIIKDKIKPDILVSSFESGFCGLFLGPKGIKMGAFISSSLDPLPVEIGNTMPLKFIPVGSRVFNVAGIAKTSGSSIQILRHKKDLTLCRLPSNEIKWVNTNEVATIGVVSNEDAKFYKYYKAGQLRWAGRRPTVRGVAMNPIDHPHGGGQGKTSGGRPSVSPFGILTKGYRTVRTKVKNRFIFKTRYAQ